MTDVGQKLGEISGKLDLVIAGQRDQWTHQQALEQRVRAVETTQATGRGAKIAYSTVGGAVGALITSIVGHNFKWPF